MFIRAFFVVFLAFSAFFSSKMIAQDSCVVTNLWPNGDFEQSQSLAASGWYLPCILVTYDPIDDLPGGNTANDIDDHTPTGGGNFLWVDHTQTDCAIFYSTGDNIPILRRNIQTAAGEAYTFSFWAYRFCDGSTGEFGVWVNGQKIDSWDIAAPPCAVGWQQYSVNFTASGPSTQITLMDVNYHSAGWDYAIDDVQLAAIFAPAPYAGEDTTICAGGCARLIAQGGQPDIVAAWSTSDFTSLAAGDTVIRVCPLQTTTYSVTVTNSQGCSDVDEVRVFVAKSPEITVDSTVCSADLAFFDIFFKVAVTADFRWKGAATAQFMIQPNGSFRLKNVPKDSVIDLLTALPFSPFCTDSVRVDPPDCSCPPVSMPVAAGPTRVEICPNAPFPTFSVAAAGPNFSLDWFDASTGGAMILQNSASFQPAAEGQFFVEKKDLTSGCSSPRLLFEVQKRPDPSFEIAGDTAVCGSSPAVFEAKSADPTVVFEWPDGSTGATFSFSAPDFQPVWIVAEARDTAGCRARDSVFLVVKKPPFFAVKSLECSADLKTVRFFFDFDPAQVHFANPDTLVLTQNGPTSGYVDARPGQLFSIVSQADSSAFSSQFCSISTSFFAPDCDCPSLAPPVATSPTTVEICDGEPFPTFSVAPQNGFSVAWFDAPTSPNPLIINELSFQPTAAGVFFAEARDTVSNCPTARRAFTFSIKPLPEIAIAGDTTVCQNQPVILTATSVPAGAKMQWTGQPPGPILNVTAAQSMSYEVSADLAGCEKSETVFVEILLSPPAPISLGDSSFCAGEPLKKIGATVGGVGLEVNWFDSQTALNPLIINQLQIQPPTAGTFWAESFDPATGCPSASRTAVRLIENPRPVVDAGPPRQILCGDSAVVLAGAAQTLGQPFSIFWTTSDGEILAGQNALAPEVAEIGTYNLLIINELTGCRDSDAVVVTKQPQLFAAFETEQPTCAEPFGKIIFEASGGSGAPFEFSIDGGQTFSSDSIFENLSPAVFDLKIRDLGGCEVALEAELLEPQKWQLSLPTAFDLALGDSVLLAPTVDSAGLIFSKIGWLPPAFLSCDTCLQTYASPSESMSYVVFATDEKGCRDSARTTVRVDPTVDFFAPTALGLAEGGDNARFMIYGGAGLERIVFLRIFDRWGGLVFDEKNLAPGDAAAGWDGFSNGKKAAPGVYVWVAELLFSDGKKQKTGGGLTVFW